MQFLSRFALAAFFAGPVVFAQTAPAKQAPPKPQPLRPFQLQQRTHYALPNGLQVNLLHYGAVPKVEIVIIVGAGSVNLDAEHAGFSALVADLMAEGTATKTGPQLARAAADMGSSISTGSSAYSSSFSMDVLSGNAPDAVGLLGDMLQHPAFSATEFARLKNDNVRQIAVSLANPGFVARKKYAELMWGAQPNGRLIPTPEQVKAFTLADVHAFYDGNYGAARTRIYVVGQFDEAVVRKAIAATFEGWKKGSAPFKPVQKVIDGPKFAFVPQAGAAQSNVIYGITAPGLNSPDTIPMFVMDALLGGSFGSRITSNIREDKGYTYSPYSTVDNRYQTALWQESAAVTSASTGPAITEIDKEIKRLQADAPPAEELAAIQHYADGIFIIRNSTRQGIAGQLNNVDFNDLTDDYLVHYTQNVDAVTPAIVQDMAKKYLKLDDMTLVVVGDPKVVEPQLKERQK